MRTGTHARLHERECASTITTHTRILTILIHIHTHINACRVRSLPLQRERRAAWGARPACLPSAASWGPCLCGAASAPALRLHLIRRTPPQATQPVAPQLHLLRGRHPGSSSKDRAVQEKYTGRTSRI